MTEIGTPSATLSRREALARLTAAGNPYELKEIELHGQRCRAFANAPPTLHDLFRDARSEATFYVFAAERYTFEQMYDRACRLAALLRDRYGIAKGDRVAISMRNYPEWVISFNAITSIGAIAVCMNAMWGAEEHGFGLEDSGARVLIADEERVHLVANRLREPGVEVIAAKASRELPAGVVRFEDLLEGQRPVPMPDVAVGPDDDATILYTSGSTGQPKGAVSCHRNIISALLSWELDFQAGALTMGITPPSTPPAHQPASLLSIPLFHVTGLHAVLLSAYRSQRKVVAMYKWDPAEAAQLIEEEQIASFVAPAAITGDLVAEARRSKRDLSSLMSVGGGGAPRAPEQVKSIAGAFERAMPNTGWGMTETNAIGTGIGGANYLARPGSSGVCSAVLDLSIVDPDGRPLPTGTPGEVLIRGTSVIRGYWNRPEDNARSFRAGWFRTGDVGYVDDEGYLYIVDRIKDLVIRGGENVGCAEVEAALLEHPLVVEAAVYGVPDDRLGEEVAATVYCSADTDAEELKAFLGDHLARFKIPRYIRFSNLPLARIATGKIDKRGIRGDAIDAGLAG